MSFLQTEDFRQTYLDTSDNTDYPTGRLEIGQEIITVLAGDGDVIMPKTPFVTLIAQNQTLSGLSNGEFVLAWKVDETNPDKFYVVRDWNNYTAFDESDWIVTTLTAPYLSGVSVINVDDPGDTVAWDYFRVGQDPQLYRVTNIAGDVVTFVPELQADFESGEVVRFVAEHFKAGSNDPVSKERAHADHEQVFIVQAKINLEEIQDAIISLQNGVRPDDLYADTLTLVNQVQIGDIKGSFTPTAGMIKYVGGLFLGYDGDEWIDLGAVGSGDTLPGGAEGDILRHDGGGWESSHIFKVTETLISSELSSFRLDASGLFATSIEADQAAFGTLSVEGLGVTTTPGLKFGYGLVGETVTGLIGAFSGEGIFFNGDGWENLAIIGKDISIDGTNLRGSFVEDITLHFSELLNIYHDEADLRIKLEEGRTNLYGQVTAWGRFDIYGSDAHLNMMPVADYPPATDGVMIYHADDGWMVYQAGAWLPITGDSMEFAAPGVAWSTVHWDPEDEEWQYTSKLLIEPVGVRVDGALIIGARDEEFPEEVGLIEYVNGDFQGIVEGPDGQGTLRVSLTNISPEQRLPSADLAAGAFMYAALNGEGRWVWKSTGIPLFSVADGRIISPTIKVGAGSGTEGVLRWNAGDSRLEWNDGATWFSLSQESTMPTPTTPGAFMIVDGSTNWAETTAVAIIDNVLTTATIEVETLRIGPDLEDNFIEFNINNFVIPTATFHKITMNVVDTEEPEFDCSDGFGSFKTLSVGTLNVTTLNLQNPDEEPISFEMERLVLVNRAANSVRFAFEPSATELKILHDDVDPYLGMYQDVTSTHVGAVNGAHNVGATVIAVDGFDTVIEAGTRITFGAKTYRIADATGIPTTTITLDSELEVALTDNQVATVKYGGLVVRDYGSLEVDYDLRVKRLATFDYSIKLNNSLDLDGEVDGVPDEPGMIRYNGDFQGRLASGQWASFTRTIMDGNWDNPWGSALYWNGTQWVKNTNIDLNADGALRLAADTDTAAVPGAMRFNGTDFQGCIDIGVWVTLTALEDLPSLPSGGEYEGATLRWSNDNWVVNPYLNSDGVKTTVTVLEINPYENFYDAGYVVHAGGYSAGSSTIALEGFNGPLSIDDELVFDGHATVYTVTARTPTDGPPTSIVITPVLTDNVSDREWLRVQGVLPRPEAKGGQLRYNQNDYEGFIEGIGWASFTGHRSWLPNRIGDSYLNAGNLLYFNGSTWVADHSSFMSASVFVLDKSLEVYGDVGIEGQLAISGIKLGAPAPGETDPVAIPGFMYYNATRNRFRGCISETDLPEAPAWIDIVSPIYMVEAPVNGQTLRYNAETDYWNNTNLLLISGGDYDGWLRTELPISFSDWQLKTEEITEGETIYQKLTLGYTADIEEDPDVFLTFFTPSEGGAYSKSLFVNTPNFFVPRIIIAAPTDGPIASDLDLGIYTIVNYGELFNSNKITIQAGGLDILAGNATLYNGNLHINQGDMILHDGGIEATEVYASGRGYFGEYIRVGYVDTLGGLPTGAIRYSFPGNTNRGDWEGWDGQQWVSFTAGFHGQAIWGEGAPTNGAMIAYDETYSGGKFIFHNNLLYVDDTLTLNKLNLQNYIDFNTDASGAASGRLRYSGTDLEFSIDGVNWISLTTPGVSGIASGTTLGDSVYWTGSLWAPSGSLSILTDRVVVNQVLQLAPYADIVTPPGGAGGMIRYNLNDYEAFITSVGWVSLTGHAPFQQPEDHTGKFLYSDGDNWVAFPYMSYFTDGDAPYETGISIGGDEGNAVKIITIEGTFYAGGHVVSQSSMAALSGIVIAGPFVPDVRLPLMPGIIQLSAAEDPEARLEAYQIGYLDLVEPQWHSVMLGINAVDPELVNGFVYFDTATGSFKNTEALTLDSELVVLNHLDVRSAGEINFGDSTGEDPFWSIKSVVPTTWTLANNDLADPAEILAWTYPQGITTDPTPYTPESIDNVVKFKDDLYLFKNANGAVYKSEDNGETWSLLGTRSNSVAQRDSYNILTYVNESNSPRTHIDAKLVMLGGRNSSAVATNVVYESSDGLTWVAKNNLPATANNSNSSFIVKQGNGLSGDKIFGVHNTGAGLNLWSNADLTAAWTSTATNLADVMSNSGAVYPSLLHADGHFIVIDLLNPDTYVYTSALGATWVARPTNWPFRVFPQFSIIGNRIWLIGGWDSDSIPVNHVYSKVLDVNSWMGWRRHNNLEVPGQIYLQNCYDDEQEKLFLHGSGDDHLAWVTAESVLVDAQTGDYVIASNVDGGSVTTVVDAYFLQDIAVSGDANFDGNIQVNDTITLPTGKTIFFGETGSISSAAADLNFPVSFGEDVTIVGDLILNGSLAAGFSVFSTDELINRGYVGIGNSLTEDPWMGVVRYTGSIQAKVGSVGLGTDTFQITDVPITVPTTDFVEARVLLGRNIGKYQILAATDLTGGVWEITINAAPEVALQEGDEVRLLIPGDWQGWTGSEWVSFTNNLGGGGLDLDADDDALIFRKDGEWVSSFVGGKGFSLQDHGGSIVRVGIDGNVVHNVSDLSPGHSLVGTGSEFSSYANVVAFYINDFQPTDANPIGILLTSIVASGAGRSSIGIKIDNVGSTEMDATGLLINSVYADDGIVFGIAVSDLQAAGTAHPCVGVSVNNITSDGSYNVAFSASNINAAVNHNVYGLLIDDLNVSGTGKKYSVYANEGEMYQKQAATFESKISVGTKTDYTILLGGIAAPTTQNAVLDTESAAATDDLGTINAGSIGQIVRIFQANAGRVITIKHNSGNILLKAGVDRVLVGTYDNVTLMWADWLTKWVEI